MVFSCLCCCHSSNHFCLYQQIESHASKVKLGEAINWCKRVLEAANFAFANQTKESITSQKLGSQDFWQIPNCVLNKGKPAIPPVFNGPAVLSSAFNKSKVYAKSFSTNSNLDDSVIFFPAFPSSTDLKLHNIHVTTRLVKKVTANQP